MKDEKYYRTSDLDLASFLFAKIQDMPEVQWLDGEKKEFAFDQTPYLEELEWVFSFGDSKDERLLVSVRDLQIARRQLLERIKRS